MEEKQLTEHESISLIHEMIQSVKNDYHESGTSALLWGSVVGIAGILTFLQWQFNFSIGFDIWLIVLLAVIPQVIISIREGRQRKFKTHNDTAMDAVWITYGITIFMVVFYINIVPYATETIMKGEGWQMIKHYNENNKPDEIMKPFVPSIGSVFLLIYGFPTLVTGVIQKFRPMIAGAVTCYVLFIVSCFTASKFDMLFCGIAGICAWFIPGLILRKRYLEVKRKNV